jgi:hypothetical protein
VVRKADTDVVKKRKFYAPNRNRTPIIQFVLNRAWYTLYVNMDKFRVRKLFLRLKILDHNHVSIIKQKDELRHLRGVTKFVPKLGTFDILLPG